MTEFYLLAEDGLRIVGEVENIGPASPATADRQRSGRALRHRLQAGHDGEGIRADFTVTESDEDVEVDADEQELVDQAQANYAAYVEDQSAQLLDEDRRSSSSSTRPATTTRPARSTRSPAPTGSGSRPWPSPSATSTR